MNKFLFIIIMVFACITITFCQEFGKDQWSASNLDHSDHKDPGGNRLGSTSSNMDATSQFQIRKSIYNINETNRLFIVEIENLYNQLGNINIQERVDNTVTVLNNSHCYLATNASEMQKVIDYLKNPHNNSINISNIANYSTRLLDGDSYMEANIPRILGDSTIIYSFEIHPKEYVDKIPFFATTIVDVMGHPSTSCDYSGEISPYRKYDVTATPDTYLANTGDTLNIEYQVEYRARTTDPNILPILITLRKVNCSYEINTVISDHQSNIVCSNGLYIINTSISPTDPMNITVNCIFRNDGVFPIPMIYIKDDCTLHPIAFSDKKITVEDEYPTPLKVSLVALIISLIALGISFWELSENRKSMKSNTKAMIDQGNKINDINTTLIKVNNELETINFNLNRIRKKMP